MRMFVRIEPLTDNGQVIDRRHATYVSFNAIEAVEPNGWTDGDDWKTGCLLRTRSGDYHLDETPEAFVRRVAAEVNGRDS